MDRYSLRVLPVLAALSIWATGYAVLTSTTLARLLAEGSRNFDPRHDVMRRWPHFRKRKGKAAKFEDPELFLQITNGDINGIKMITV